MPAEKLTQYLERENVHYEVIEHARVYTAQEAAAAAHVSGDALAKAVLLIVDGEMAMAVLPASYRVNLEALKTNLGADSIRMATEKEFTNQFPDCEVGALPPFGNLYGMQVFADQRLSHVLEIVFCAGSHTELLKITLSDFQKLAEPRMLRFSYQR